MLSPDCICFCPCCSIAGASLLLTLVLWPLSPNAECSEAAAGWRQGEGRAELPLGICQPEGFGGTPCPYGISSGIRAMCSSGCGLWWEAAGVQASAGQAQHPPTPRASHTPADAAEMLLSVTPQGHQTLGRRFVTPALYRSRTAPDSRNVPAR